VRNIVCFLVLAGLVMALPPRPGLLAPEPVYPAGVEVAGPNKLKGYDYCETVTILMQFPDNRADTLARPVRFDALLNRRV